MCRPADPLTREERERELEARWSSPGSSGAAVEAGWSLGSALFDVHREGPAFILNRSPWDKAQILLARDNFGCGSSREHAPWALLDFGIRCVIAPSFADIFINDCHKNGILPIVPDV